MEGRTRISRTKTTATMAALVEVRHLMSNTLLVVLFASSVFSQFPTITPLPAITIFDSPSCYQGNCDVGVLDIQGVLNELA